LASTRILVDLDTEYEGDLLSDAPAAEARIPLLHLDDHRINSALGSFWPGFRRLLGAKSKRYLRLTKARWNAMSVDGFSTPTHSSDGPFWLTFLGHAKDSLWSVDLFRCESLILKTHWVMKASAIDSLPSNIRSHQAAGDLSSRQQRLTTHQRCSASRPMPRLERSSFWTIRGARRSLRAT
jgi:hypothetical protein